MAPKPGRLLAAVERERKLAAVCVHFPNYLYSYLC